MAQADKEPGNWYMSGRDANEQHYSPLALIDAQSVHSLGFAWAYDASPLSIHARDER